MDMSRERMIEILEDIAENSGNAAARIAAIKQLNEMNPPTRGGSGFDDLEEPTELEQRRRIRTKVA